MTQEDIADLLKKDPKRWLVTGGAGFIGSHLVERLLSLGQSVTVLDDFSSGFERNVTPHKNLTVETGDIRNPLTCAAACEKADIVLHHAAIGSVSKSFDDPVLVDAVNVGGTLTLLMTAIKAGASRFIFASSSAVYGDSGKDICTEDQALYPISPYAVTKRACEYYTAIVGKHHGICTTGLRYFNIFGPRQDPNGAYAAVIPKWMDSMVTGHDIHINGDGKTVRDFCFIDDVVNANLLAALSDPSVVDGQAYNIASGAPTTLNELYAGISGALGVSGTSPVRGEFRAGDIRVSCAAIDKAARDLGYAPQTTLEDGLARTATWYKGRA